MSRFEEPTFISSGFGITLASANCDQTWSGPFEGYWSLPCSLATPVNVHADESVQSAEAQAYALHYIRNHESRLWRGRARPAWGAPSAPFIPSSRCGSTTTSRHVLTIGLWSAWACTTCSPRLAVGGTVVLLRRRVPVLPLLAIGIDVVVTVLVSFGQTRYRTPFEVSLVLLAAVQLDAAWGALRRTGPALDVAGGRPRGARAGAETAPAAPPVPAPAPVL